MTGMYVILVELDRAKEIVAGRKHRFAFQKGFYAYVGSALAGLERRLARHLGARRRLHWHIDYLLNAAEVRIVICAETSDRKECVVAQTLSRRLPAVTKFGCSDCHCPSHLFFCQDPEALKGYILDAFRRLDLNPLVII